jgi:hypothetical protein
VRVLVVSSVHGRVTTESNFVCVTQSVLGLRLFAGSKSANLPLSDPPATVFELLQFVRSRLTLQAIPRACDDGLPSIGSSSIGAIQCGAPASDRLRASRRVEREAARSLRTYRPDKPCKLRPPRPSSCYLVGAPGRRLSISGARSLLRIQPSLRCVSLCGCWRNDDELCMCTPRTRPLRRRQKSERNPFSA